MITSLFTSRKLLLMTLALAVIALPLVSTSRVYAQNTVFPFTQDVKIGTSGLEDYCEPQIFNTTDIIASITNPTSWINPADWDNENSNSKQFYNLYMNSRDDPDFVSGMSQDYTTFTTGANETGNEYSIHFYFSTDPNAKLQYTQNDTYLEATNSVSAYFVFREAFKTSNDDKCDIMFNPASYTPGTIAVGGFSPIFGEGITKSVYYSDYELSPEVDPAIPENDPLVSDVSFSYEVNALDIKLQNITPGLPENHECTWMIDNDPSPDGDNSVNFREIIQACDVVVNHTFNEFGTYTVSLYVLIDGETQSKSRPFVIDGSSYKGSVSIRGGDDLASIYKDCSTYGTDLIGGFTCIMGNFITMLKNLFITLFVPSPLVARAIILDLQTFLLEKFGFLAYPFTFFFAFFGNLLGAGDSCSQTFAGNFFGSNGITLNYCQTISQGWINTIRLLIQASTVVGLMYAFKRKWDEVTDK